ncbi:MAG: sulfite exporter TauE/SafE family protein [Chloroflexota bacterium]
METNVWALAGTGLLAGFIGSLLGLGGGIFVVPLLTLALGVPIQSAIGTSLVGVAATSSTASITYLRERLTNIRLAMVLESATTMGAVLGALLAVYLSQTFLAALFGCITVYTAYNMARRPRDKEASAQQSGKTVGTLTSSYYDRSQDRVVSYEVRRLPAGMGASVIAGAVSGMLGVGGGFIKVPVMNLVMSVPFKAAIATSNLMVGITAVASAFIYFYRGYVSPEVAAPVVIGICFGAWLGSKLAWRASGLILRRVFVIVLGAIAIMMFLKAAGTGI